MARARAALEELEELQQEYQEWYDNLPDNLQQTPLAEKLEAVCELDIADIVEQLDELENADLPRGFGRD